MLKLRASRPSSSVPLGSIRCDGSRVPASSSVRRVKRPIGASAVRATSAASAAPSATPAAPTSEQHEQHAVELAVHLVERARQLDRAALGPPLA